MSVQVDLMYGMFDMSLTLLLGEAVEHGADRSSGGLDGAWVLLAHQRIDLGEHLFDRVEIGAVSRGEHGPGAGGMLTP